VKGEGGGRGGEVREAEGEIGWEARPVETIDETNTM